MILLVPAEAEPAKAVENGIERSFSVALDIGVVHAQHHGAAEMARKEPIEKESARASNVQKAGR